MPAIDGDRLLRDLYAVREIGKYKTGVHRPTFSPQDVEARHWLAARLTEAGLDTSIDGIGNVYGRDPSTRAQAADRQPYGDAEPRRLAGRRHGRHLRPGGRPHAGAWHRCRRLGGRGGAFRLVPRQPVILRPADGAGDRRLRQPGNRRLACATRCARRGSPGGPRQKIDPARYRGYLEAHIEQGADLEDHHLRLGIVTAIVGSRRFRIQFNGQQNHAGTTRMAVRKDAGVALVKFVAAIEARFPAVGGPADGLDDGRHQARSRRRQHRAGRARNWCFSSATPIPAMLDALDSGHGRTAGRGARGPCEVTVTYRGTHRARAPWILGSNAR